MAEGDPLPRSYVVARCVACAHERRIQPGEIPEGDHPMCAKCFSPMVPVSAVGVLPDDDGV